VWDYVGGDLVLETVGGGYVCWTMWEVIKCVGNCGRWLSVLETVEGG
jgi:hypothetical protein